MLAWGRAHPRIARNALFLLFAVPLASLGRRLLITEGLAGSDVLGALSPALAVSAGLVLAKLVCDRLDIPRR
jgi:hypothetical protein